jgi:Ca2+-binding EF-hand superfamily protein
MKRWLKGADKMNTLAKTTIIGATVIALMGSVSIANAKQGGEGKGKGPRINFEQLDTDGDGFITKAELQAAHEARFAKNDTDGDGFLSAEELEASKAKMGKGKKGGEGQSDRKKARMMRYMDENGDGKVALSEIPTDRMDRMIGKLDTDEDGKVSKEEFEARKMAKGKKGKKHSEE